MTDDTKTTLTTDAPPSGGDGQTAGQGTGAQATGAAPTAGLTQEQVNEIVQKRLASEQRKADATKAELQAELDRLRAAEEERRQAELSEIDRAKAAAEKAQAEVAAAKAEAKAAQITALRANLIATEAATLPNAYKALVEGDDDEAVKASIAAVKAQHEADRNALMASLTSMTPEQIAEQFGEEGKALAERMKGAPVSIGAPSNAAGGGAPTPPADYGPENRSLEAWKKERARRGYPTM